jgi:hypothetical protein
MKQPTERFKAGDFVYFSAYSEKKDNTSFFLCRGYVTSLALGSKIAYKLIVTEVYPESLLCGHNPELAKGLLGRKITRDNLMAKINYWSLVIGSKEPTREWLKPDQKTSEHIKTYLKSKNINVSAC